MENQQMSLTQSVEVQNCECRSCLLKGYVHIDDDAASIDSTEDYNYPLPHDFECDCEECIAPHTFSGTEQELEQQGVLRRVQLDRAASFVDDVMDRLDYESQTQDQSQPQEEELDDYDEVPCQGCGEPVPRGDVNQYRHGWWCSRHCAFWQWM